MTDYKYNAILIDKDGGFWGPFETLAESRRFCDECRIKHRTRTAPAKAGR